MDVSGQLHAPGTLLPVKKKPWGPLNRRLSGLQRLSDRFGGERNVSRLRGNEPRFLGLRAHSLVTIPDSRLLTLTIGK